MCHSHTADRQTMADEISQAQQMAAEAAEKDEVPEMEFDDTKVPPYSNCWWAGGSHALTWCWCTARQHDRNEL